MRRLWFFLCLCMTSQIHAGNNTNALFLIEQAISEQTQAIDDTEHKIKQIQTSNQQLSKQLTQIEHKQSETFESLSNSIRFLNKQRIHSWLFQMITAPNLKNQARMNHLSDSLLHAHQTQLKHWETALSEYKATLAAFKAQQSELENLTTHYKQQESILTQQREHRLKTISSYPQDSFQVEKLLFDLYQGLPQESGDLKDLNTHRHLKDILPHTKGRFCDSQACFLETSERQPIYPLAAGEIIFSNWLPDLGFTAILHHGHGIISLYGHLSSPAPPVHTKISTQQTLGMTGNTGGHQKIGLYLDIRVQGRPQSLAPLS